MPVRSCKVTIQDMDGVAHTVGVTAATLYEAVALGMAAIRTDEWVTGIAQGLNSVKVRVMNVAENVIAQDVPRRLSTRFPQPVHPRLVLRFRLTIFDQKQTLLFSQGSSCCNSSVDPSHNLVAQDSGCKTLVSRLATHYFQLLKCMSPAANASPPVNRMIGKDFKKFIIMLRGTSVRLVVRMRS